MAHVRRFAHNCLWYLWIAIMVTALPSSALAQERATLTGTVTDANGVKQAAIPVIITTAAGVDRRAASNVDGVYTLGGLQPGEYRLRVDDDRFAPWSQDKVTLGSGERKTIDIKLLPKIAANRPAAMSGTVIGPSGQPLGGVVLVLSGPGGEKRVTSATTGAYAFPELGAGTYRVRADQRDALPFASSDLVIAAGESRQFDVRLQPLPPPPPPPAATTTPAGTTPPKPTPDPKPAKAPRGPVSAADSLPVPEAIMKGLEAAPDRWHIDLPQYRRYNPPQKMPFVPTNPMDPYNQNQFKGDFPLGNSHTFLNLNLQFNSTMNPQEQTSADPLDAGGTQALFYNQNAVLGAEVFGGSAAFEPKRWSARATAVANINSNSVDGFSFDNVKKTFTLEEAFGEKRLAVLGPEFDIVSVRGGMQNFNSDFRGFLFFDNEFGVRLFGNASANRRQYNAAFFSMRQRKGNFHDITKTICPIIPEADRADLQCGQNVFIGNIYMAVGQSDAYIVMFNFHLNQDNRETFVGLGKQRVTYLGFHGDGHWGPWSVNHAFYQAFGTDEDNELAFALERDSSVKVNAMMGAFELARDSDARRIRGSFFFASGDKGDDPSKAGGFDAIQDNPNFAGGQFQFWTQQGIAVPGIGLISNKNSLLPNIRNKTTERSNFINPGLMLFGGGVDIRQSPSLKLVTNVNMLRFANVSSLNQIRLLTVGDAPFTDTNIGLDMSVGFKWRPFVNENLFIVGGAAFLKPMGGFAEALGRTGLLSSTFATFQIAY